MKWLVLSSVGEGCWFAWLLQHNGHEVDVLIKEDGEFQNIFKGLLNVGSATKPEDYDGVLFDLTGQGRLADQVREVTPTIGDSRLADKLEHDRTFGLEYMEKCGISVPPYTEFDNPGAAMNLIRKTKKRYVYKASGSNADCATTYVSKNAEDMEGYLETLFKQTPSHEFILQEVVQGIEVSTEMWINETGVYAINHTLEEKKLLAGGLGPNCGCAGNLVWMPDMETTLFTRGLGRAAEQLISDGYVGMIDLNAIVSDGQVWGLEWTPRIGYEGTCNLTSLLSLEFGEFLGVIASGQKPPEITSKHGFAATIRVYIPPYPTVGSARLFKPGVPLDGLNRSMLPDFFLYDARLKDEETFETAGISGWIGSPIGVGSTIAEAFESCKQVISRLRIPDMGYRNDVAESVAKRYAELASQGWLKVEWKAAAA